MPRLSLWQMETAGTCLAMFMMLSLVSFTRAFLIGSFILYFFYFSGLFCESLAGSHATLPVPSILFFLGT